MSTVDWSQWPNLTAIEQDELRRQYKAIIRQEIEHAKATGFRAMNDALENSTVSKPLKTKTS
jgi:hypothetical protein